MIVHSVKVTPVRGKDGKYHMVEEEFDEYVPDENVRHNKFCSVCGFPDYPECMSWCKCAEPIEGEDD